MIETTDGNHHSHLDLFTFIRCLCCIFSEEFVSEHFVLNDLKSHLLG